LARPTGIEPVFPP